MHAVSHRVTGDVTAVLGGVHSRVPGASCQHPARGALTSDSYGR